MSVIQIYINLKIPDNIERSAQYACRSRLGFHAMESLRRTEFWELDFPGLEPKQARQTAERLVEKTSLFANPNKHLWRIEAAEQAVSQDGALQAPSSISAYILVCDREDGKAESTLDAVRRKVSGSEQPSSLLRGVLWEVTFSGLTPEEIRSESERLAVSVTRSQGLLANPHYQTYRIFYP
ncbi:MAG: hypothetical protein JXR73_17830 [Candidatus Omnitrophica bacterium]|nr:hypothetical protein [Candidatus Omnitrophota bacterium]